MQAYLARRSVSCPLCKTNTDLLYHSETTVRFRCRSSFHHQFSIALSELKKELPWLT